LGLNRKTQAAKGHSQGMFEQGFHEGASFQWREIKTATAIMDGEPISC
jgi:hypothetical protein